MKPIRIRLENYEGGTGVIEKPSIAWEYGAEGVQFQKAVRLELVLEGQFVEEIPWTVTGEQRGFVFQSTLKSHRTYQVNVSVENFSGEIESGVPFYFTTGICSREDWKGRWISDMSNKPHILGYHFICKKQIKQAILSVTGVGQYEIQINGKSADDSVFNGVWTDFNKTIHYRTYCLKDLISNESNQIEIAVGNGWYHHRKIDERHFYTYDKGYQVFGKYLAVNATMHVYYQDGSCEVIGTSNEWYTKEEKVLYTNIYGSEDYDFTKHQKIEKAVELCVNDCPAGSLEPMRYPPVIIKKSYNGKLIQKTRKSFLYDFGQNMSGLLEITLCGEKSQSVRISPGEKLDNNGKLVKTTNTYCCLILSGGNDCYRQKFTYMAGRYILIETDDLFILPAVIDIKAHFITSAAEDVSSFCCSDSRYEEIRMLILKAIESNLNHVHTDCPTIERLGWQEPNHLMGPSIMYHKNVNTLFSKIAKDQRESQYCDGESDVDKGAFPHKYGSGLLTSIAPRYAKFTFDCGEGSFWDIIPWGSSILLAAKELERFYGNEETLLDNFETAKRYVMYEYQKYLDYQKIYCKEEGTYLCHGLGDWGIEQNKGCARENVETAYLYKDMCLLNEIAKKIGKEEEAIRYKKLSGQILERYNNDLLRQDENGNWYYRSVSERDVKVSQVNQAIPYLFGMVPEDKTDSLQKSFLNSVKDGMMHSGEVGLVYLFRMLGELKQPDLVHQMIMQKMHPSYYRFILQGETTLPEFWRDDARSRNHDMMGSVLEWFYRYMIGLISEDGFKTMKIEPMLPKSVNKVSCSYKSVKGTIVLLVKRVSDNIKITVLLPTNTKATIHCNGKKYEIDGGIEYQLQ